MDALWQLALWFAGIGVVVLSGLLGIIWHDGRTTAKGQADEITELDRRLTKLEVIVKGGNGTPSLVTKVEEMRPGVHDGRNALTIVRELEHRLTELTKRVDLLE